MVAEGAQTLIFFVKIAIGAILELSKTLILPKTLLFPFTSKTLLVAFVDCCIATFPK